jgi:hypothetical protein
MNTKVVLAVSAALEAATGIALIVVPNLVARLLLGTDLASSGIAVARVAGFALLALAIACWPGRGDTTTRATRALFLYNLLAGVFLGYLRFGGGFDGFLLLPASIGHVLFAILLARPAYRRS